MSHEKKRLVASLLVDGMGPRAIARVVGTSVTTVCKFVVDLGAGCLEFLDSELRGLTIKTLQCDEMWSFIGSKARPAWTWMAIDPVSKLLLTWRIGNRSLATGKAFMDDIHQRVSKGVTITTDAHNVYSETIDQHAGTNHSIAVAGGYKARYLGVASTYAVERHNLTIRTSISRYARSTNGFSKSPPHMNAHLAIYALNYNYVRVHQTLRVTPAMELGLADAPWSLDDLLEFHPVDYRNGTLRIRKQVSTPAEILSRRLDTFTGKRVTAKTAGRRDHALDSLLKISQSWNPKTQRLAS